MKQQKSHPHLESLQQSDITKTNDLSTAANESIQHQTEATLQKPGTAPSTSNQNATPQVQPLIGESIRKLEYLEHQIETIQIQLDSKKQELGALTQESLSAQHILESLLTSIEEKSNFQKELIKEINKRRSCIRSLKDEIKIIEDTHKKNLFQNQQNIAHEIEKKDAILKATISEIETKKRQLTTDFKKHHDDLAAQLEISKKKLLSDVQKEEDEFRRDLYQRRQKSNYSMEQIIRDANEKASNIIKSAENTTSDMLKESQDLCVKIEDESRQKAAEILTKARLEADESRRRWQHETLTLLKDQNKKLALLDAAVASERKKTEEIKKSAQLEADQILAQANKRANDMISNAEKTAAAMKENAELLALDLLSQTKATTAQETLAHEQLLEQKRRIFEQKCDADLQQLRTEQETLISEAQERAQLILDSANSERQSIALDIDREKSDMMKHVRSISTRLISEAESTAARMIELSKTRAENIDATVDAMIKKAEAESARISAAAEDYAKTVRKQVPDLDKWEEALASIRAEEKQNYDRALNFHLQSQKKFIADALHELNLSLPKKYQNIDAIQDFFETVMTRGYQKSA